MTAAPTTNGQRPAPDVRAEARQVWLDFAAEGTPLSGAELGRRFDRSPQWGRQVAAEARQELAARPAEPGRPEADPGGAMAPPAVDVAVVAPATPPPAAAMAPPGEPPATPVAVRRVTAAAVALVAAVAAAASYSHMHRLAVLAGEGDMAYLLPLSVDGLVVAASMTLLSAHREHRRAGVLPWLALLLGLGASLAANVAAAEPTVVGRLVAAWPPLALALSFELLLRQGRDRGGRPG